MHTHVGSYAKKKKNKKQKRRKTHLWSLFSVISRMVFEFNVHLE